MFAIYEAPAWLSGLIVAACVVVGSVYLTRSVRANTTTPKRELAEAEPVITCYSSGVWYGKDRHYPWTRGPALRIDGFEWGLRVRARSRYTRSVIPDSSWTWEQIDSVEFRRLVLLIRGVEGTPSVGLSRVFLGKYGRRLIQLCEDHGVRRDE